MLALHKSGRLAVPGQITVVDRGDALLGQFSDKAHEYALEKLTEAGAQVRLGVGVTAVHPDRVQFDDGSAISARTVVWGGGRVGVCGRTGRRTSPGRGGRLDVRPDLTVAGYPGTYAVGDVANIPSGDDAAALPQLGSVAQQSGKWAGQNILRELRGKPTEPFVYKDKGIMAMIGRNAAVAEVGKHHHQVEGPVAFAAWLGVHAMLLSGVHSKIDAFLTWGWDYFDRDHAATIEATAATPERLAWADHGEDLPHIVLDRPEATSRAPALKPPEEESWPTEGATDLGPHIGPRLEDSVEQRGDPEGYGQKQHHPPEEDGSAEEDDRHPGRGYGEGHRVQRRKTDAGGEQDDRHSPAALTQESHHPVRPGSQLCPNGTGRLARALAYLPHQT